MGWCSGSELFSDLWRTVQKYVPDKDKNKIVKKWIEKFEEHDCDTLDECCDEFPEVEKVFKKLYPDYFEEDNESAS